MSLLQSPTPKKNTPTKLLDGPNMIACLLKPEISGVPHNQKEGYSHSQQTYIYICICIQIILTQPMDPERKV